MRIVIDMQGAQTESRFRGIGRYSLAFVQAIVRNRGEHEVYLALSNFFPETIGPIRAAFDGLLPQENIRVWSAIGSVKECQPDNTWSRETAEIIREAFLASLRPDIIHVTSLFEGYLDDAVTSIGRFDKFTPVSVSLYDLIPLLNPEQYLKPNPSYQAYYQRKVDYLEQASLLLAISDFSRKESLEYLNVSSNTIVNVSTAISDHFRPIKLSDNSIAEYKKKFGIVCEFILYTGGADERKNLPRLIEAYSLLSPSLRKRYQLVLAGKMNDSEINHLKSIAKKAGLDSSDICFTSYISDEELIALYNMSELFVFPSWHEGFGLPALEAMACGTAVIGSNTSSIPEVIGRDDALFDPLDVDAISACISRTLEDNAFRNELRPFGLVQAQKFSWDDTAKRAIRAFELYINSQHNSKSITCAEKQIRPRLAFVSPLPPERTGIADYSAELLPELSKYYDIELIVTQSKVTESWCNKHGKIRSVQWFREHVSEIDRVIYQVGNSPFHQHMLALIEEIPGTVVLHDFFLSGLLSHAELHGSEFYPWSEALYNDHGYKAIQSRFMNSDIESVKRDYPVNYGVLQQAQGIIVHSEFSCGLAKQWYGAGTDDSFRIIPLVRKSVKINEKKHARSVLSIASDDFVVCSFGFLDESKLNHRLLQAWMNCDLGRSDNCKLIFVGENNGGSYGTSLLKMIVENGLDKKVHITGFTEAAMFNSYLSAADLAVQLRTNSRGETSAAVLDCMNNGLATIVNANGSMAELPSDAVCLLPDEFEDRELIDALETLWHDNQQRLFMGEKAKAVIHTKHSPVNCALQYVDAIEGFYHESTNSVPRLIDSIVSNNWHTPNDAECRMIAQSIARSMPQKKPARRLFLDITTTCRSDLKTGIERVARALTLAMISSPPAGYRVEPVYLETFSGQWHYRYARKYTLGLLGCAPDVLDDDVVEPENGDTLLTLDLSGDFLIHAVSSGLLKQYRNVGVDTYAVVFDLLPVLLPSAFPPGASALHINWLNAITQFNGALCISSAVADELVEWYRKENIKCYDGYKIKSFHLGADVDNSAPTRGLPSDAAYTLKKIHSHPSFLMVGTIEPRKGYLQTIEAFSLLWDKGIEVNLVVVGKEGWLGLPHEYRRTIPDIVHRIKHHPELGRHLFWLDGASDEYLNLAYSSSSCLIAASEGEGFGLPLIEAAQKRIPIIARDIPVFREVAGEHAYYFSGFHADDLAKSVADWIELYNKNEHPKSDDMSWLTWQQSADSLLKAINII